jgi:Tfp pilus assembly protein PilO
MRQYLLIIINFVAGFILVVLFGISQYQDLQNLRWQANQMRAELQSRQNYFKKLTEISLTLDKYPTEMEKIKSAFPTYSSLASALDFFQKTASQESLVLKKVEFGNLSLVMETPQVKNQIIHLEVAGSYSSFKQFVSILEKSSRLINIESLSFSLPEKEDIFLFSLNVSVNFVPWQ